MNFLANPRSSMWLCRLVPAVTWALWLVAILSDQPSRHDLTVTDILLLVSLGLYLPLVLYILPAFLFGGGLRSVSQKIGYLIFAGMTAGLGPVVWYFVSVDRVLRRMAKERK
jgi:hypothetical protein